MTAGVVSVEDLSSYIRSLLERDALLQDVWVEGEVSRFTIASSGHAYLTLQQDSARIDGVMWRALVGRQRFIPRVGDNIVVHGKITTYDRQGKYQLLADVFQPAGIGILQLRLEQLRQKLEAEGLFDPARKRELPLFPRRIGVATSATGAVWHDIQTVIGRRYPLAELVLAPTLVQGDGAPDAIVSALALLQGEPDLDLIILARGGGSMEDLWCFNDERVARAIFASRYPVISAIGHETDVTIADYVADIRAPTPSAAAELAVPSREELAGFLNGLTTHAAMLVEQRIETATAQLSALVHRLERTSPAYRLVQQHADVDAMAAKARALDSLHWAPRATEGHPRSRICIARRQYLPAPGRQHQPADAPLDLGCRAARWRRFSDRDRDPPNRSLTASYAGVAGTMPARRQAAKRSSTKSG